MPLWVDRRPIAQCRIGTAPIQKGLAFRGITVEHPPVHHVVVTDFLNEVDIAHEAGQCTFHERHSPDVVAGVLTPKAALLPGDKPA